LRDFLWVRVWGGYLWVRVCGFGPKEKGTDLNKFERARLRETDESYRDGRDKDAHEGDEGHTKDQ